MSKNEIKSFTEEELEEWKKKIYSFNVEDNKENLDELIIPYLDYYGESLFKYASYDGFDYYVKTSNDKFLPLIKIKRNLKFMKETYMIIFYGVEKEDLGK